MCHWYYCELLSGVLPRPKGDYEDKALPKPQVIPSKSDSWTPKKAQFGQNDYIGKTVPTLEGVH